MTHSTHIITVSLTLIDLEVDFICQVVYTLYCVMVENRKGGGWHFSHYRNRLKSSFTYPEISPIRQHQIISECCRPLFYHSFDDDHIWSGTHDLEMTIIPTSPNPFVPGTCQSSLAINQSEIIIGTREEVPVRMLSISVFVRWVEHQVLTASKWTV